MAAPSSSPIAPADVREPVPTVLVERRSRLRHLSRGWDLYVPLLFLAAMLFACFLWPLIYSLPSPIIASGVPDLSPFSPGHLFGTDQLGNDVFSRILYGGRVSLEVGFGSTLLGLIAGGLLGSLAAYRRGIVEAVIMRILEIFLSFPSLVLAIVVATYLGPSELHVIWAISFFAVPYFGRLARANALQVAGSNYVLAAKLTGASDSRIMVRHVIPNIAFPLMTFGFLGVGVAVIVEAALSFLGLGVPPPGASWGNMIAVGQQNLTSAPDLVIIPGAFLVATVLALNLAGDALRLRWGV